MQNPLLRNVKAARPLLLQRFWVAFEAAFRRDQVWAYQLFIIEIVS
jgi:hypothetical protein